MHLLDPPLWGKEDYYLFKVGHPRTWTDLGVPLVSKIGWTQSCLKAISTCFHGSSACCAGGTCHGLFGGTYTIVAGDYLDAVRQACNVTLAALESANPQIADFNVIHVGDKVIGGVRRICGS